MVEYKCFRCGYKATQKSNLMNHFNRKNICNAKICDISIENMQKYYNFEIKSTLPKTTPKQHPHDTQNSVIDFAENNTQTTPKLTKNDTQTTPKQHPNDTQRKSKEDSEDILTTKDCLKSRICEYCNKTFTRKSGLIKHLKICEKKKEDDNLKIKKLEEENSKLLETVEKLMYESKGNIINNNTTNNNTTDNSTHINVISLNNYGSEDTQYITKEYLMGLLEKPFKSIPELIKYTHFNKEHPENHNIKLTNKKEPYVKILKDNKWQLADRKDTINDLIDQKHSILNTVDIKNEFEKKLKDRIEIFNNKYLNDDKKFIDKLYKDSELVLLNNS